MSDFYTPANVLANIYIESVHPIILEASSKEDNNYLSNMGKSDINQVNGQLTQNLYSISLQSNSINFKDIPESAGVIEKCSYFKIVKESLDTLMQLYEKNKIKEPHLYEVKTAINNIKQHESLFTEGFRIHHEFIELTYNSLVMSIIDATASLVLSYTDYLTSNGNVEYKTSFKYDKMRGYVCFNNLNRFNESVKKGNFRSALNFMIEETRKSFSGADIVITGSIIAVLLSVIPIIRELIYFYYHSRVKLSDYLSIQADFLEMNKLTVASSNRNTTDKKNIQKKQEETIKRLRKMSDKIAINNIDTNDVVQKQLKQENSMWSLTNIEKQINNNKIMGNIFQLA